MPRKSAPPARPSAFLGRGWSHLRPPLRFEPLEERITPFFYSTSTALASSANPSAAGQTITLTATVQAIDLFFGNFPPPGGSVSFTDGTTPLKTVGIDPATGEATFQTGSLSAGSHSLRAVYTGYNDFFFGDTYQGSEGDLTQTVNAPSNNDGNNGTTNQTPANPPPNPPLYANTQVSGSGDAVRLFAVGADAGGPPVVRVFNADGSSRFDIQAFDPGFTGGVRVAVGDVNGDGTPDVIAGAGPGGAPLVRIFSGADGSLVREFQAFESSFTGGVFVAAGDVNNDGHADVVATPDEGGGPRARVFSGADGSQIADFLAIDDPNFRGGARAAFGDLNGDGTPDLIVGAGFGGGPRLAAFDGTSLSGTPQKLFGDFFVFEQALRNGVYVGSGDLNRDGSDDLLVGGGPGGAPRVMALDGQGLLGGAQTQLANFFAGDPNLRGGVRLSVADAADGTPEIMTAFGPGGASQVQAFHADGSAGDTNLFAFDPSFRGGAFVAGSPAGLRLREIDGTTAPLGQLAIKGHFVAGADTSVIFEDSQGYKVEVPATQVTGNQVLVGTPIYFDPKTGQFGNSGGDLKATVVQRVGGNTIHSGAATYGISDLPQTGVAPGHVTSVYLTEMQKLIDGAVQNYQKMAAAHPDVKGTTDSIIQNLQAIKQSYADFLTKINPLIAGQVASVNVGTVFGHAASLDLPALGALDRVLLAAVANSSSAATSKAPRDAAASDDATIQSGIDEVTGSLTPQQQDDYNRRTSGGWGLIGLGTFTATAEFLAGALTGGVAAAASLAVGVGTYFLSTRPSVEATAGAAADTSSTQSIDDRVTMAETGSASRQQLAQQAQRPDTNVGSLLQAEKNAADLEPLQRALKSAFDAEAQPQPTPTPAPNPTPAPINPKFTLYKTWATDDGFVVLAVQQAGQDHASGTLQINNRIGKFTNVPVQNGTSFGVSANADPGEGTLTGDFQGFNADGDPESNSLTVVDDIGNAYKLH